MPLYDFRCEDCGTVFEVRATIKDKETGLNPVCPACHGSRVRQLIAVGLLIRGSDGAQLSVPTCDPGARTGCCG